MLRRFWRDGTAEFHGEFVDLTIDPAHVTTVSGRSPSFYFGGLSTAARECAATAADVFLMWPDTIDQVRAVVTDMDARAALLGRRLRYGWRSHVIVRETEDEARAWARRLLSRLDAGVLQPDVRAVALQPLFTRIAADFAPQALAAGLAFRAVPTPIAIDV